MHQEVILALHQAINAALAGLPRPATSTLIRRTLRTREHNAWVGREVVVSGPPDALGRVDYTKYLKALTEAIQRHHPEYIGLATSSLGGGIRSGPDVWLGYALLAIWERAHAWDVPQATVHAVVKDIEQYVDDPLQHYTCIIPLSGLSSDVSGVICQVNDRAQVRRLTRQEINDLFGGPREATLLPWDIPDFALFVDVDEPKAFGDNATPPQIEHIRVDALIRRFVLAAITFKSGYLRSRFGSADAAAPPHCQLGWRVRVFWRRQFLVVTGSRRVTLAIFINIFNTSRDLWRPLFNWLATGWTSRRHEFAPSIRSLMRQSGSSHFFLLQIRQNVANSDSDSL